MTERIRVIVNPAAGRGRGARRLPAVRAAFAARGIEDVRITMAPGDEARLAREGLDAGCTTIVAVGGDGTWSKVASELAGSDCRLAVVSAGTGNDFAKSIGAPAEDASAIARLVVEGADGRIDMARVGDTRFLNVAGFGFDTAVATHMQTVAWLRGEALYLYAALRQLFAFGGLEAAVQPGPDAGFHNHLLLAICNGQRFGGSFRIAPNARVDDGLLDAVAVGDATPVRRAQLFAAAMQGRHVEFGEVSERRAAAFSLRFRHPPAFQADGELYQSATDELEVACLPGALRVVAPPRAVTTSPRAAAEPGASRSAG